MPKLAGEVVGCNVKEFGKGKGAKSRRIWFARVKLERAGMTATLEYPLTDEEYEAGEFNRGDQVVVDVGQPQQKLALDKGKRRGAPATAN